MCAGCVGYNKLSGKPKRMGEELKKKGFYGGGAYAEEPWRVSISSALHRFAWTEVEAPEILKPSKAPHQTHLLGSV